MSLFRELSYEGVDVDDIVSVQFCLLDPDDIKKRSVVHVTTTETYIGNEPVLHGLYDPRMGVTDATRLCATCEQRSTFCPGHFGHVELAAPVFYYQFMGNIRKILKSVCIRCSKLLYGLDTPEMQGILRKTTPGITRWNLVHKLCAKVTACGQHNVAGCGAKNPEKIVKDSIKGFLLEWKPGVLNDDTMRKQTFGAQQVLEILRRISDDDVLAMGMSPRYSRPEWMICTILPVPPPAVRPCVHHDTGQRQEDDLSYTLCHIIKNNNTLVQRLKKGDRAEHIDGFVLQLQYYVATLVENQIQGITPPTHKRSGRTLRSLADRLKGKEGRIRGNLMGKRVDFSARSVITPDPNISIDEVGVPLRIAMNLTFPEIVNEFNRAWLQDLVANGPNVHPGAKMVRKMREGGRFVRLQNRIDRSVVKLDLGDVVERHLIDGDYVLFNRQPSLHRMSMMGHRVRVMPYNTFRINTSVCTSFNADFDGDEMNMHVPQSYTTAIELEKLTSVNTQIISPKNSEPIIRIVQDTVLGLWRMTQDDVKIYERDLFNLLSVLNFGIVPEMRVPARIDDNGNKYWSGKDLLSTLIPPHISIATKNNQDQTVVISNGNVVSGVVDAGVYHKATRGLVHSVFAECGPIVTRDLFDNTQKLVCSWLMNTGFSVGVSDLLIEKDVSEYLTKVTRDKKKEVYHMIDDVHSGKFQNKDIMSDGAYLETRINNTLNDALSMAGEAISRMMATQGNNRMLQMITSGSKGSNRNMTQMVGFLGQQNVEGKRVMEGYEDRTLPHFTKYDDGPDARGFVETSFMKGLSPVEFFFHAMGGRDGLIDTAVKSVSFDTEISLIVDGKFRKMYLGEFIDAQLDGDRKHLVQHFPEDRNMEYLKLDTEVYIPTCDADGETSWGRLTAVTRHDPGERVYKIKTHGGRSVTVAESPSLLIWDAENMQFVKKDSREVQIGDYVPVTAMLSEPPVVIDHVDMTQYFPKSEYVYGTEFSRARNHSDQFTLPFKYRSNIETIKNADFYREGCIYCKKGHSGGHFPDTFELDYQNGVFIGLFLADGNSDTPRNKVRISKEDETVQAFLNGWFDKYGISHRVETCQKMRGVSTSVIACSRLLALFLDAFVGKGSRHKHVPEVAFNAPLEFVKGIINGYFSGDGCIAANGGIQSSSVSHRLTEEIAWLCTRIGVFGKLGTIQQKSNNIGTVDIASARTLSIRGQFAMRFAEQIDLIYEDKNRKLKETHFAESHAKFEEYNDVVLDKIVSIEITGTEEYPKLYDVTVPSTYNFVLANGLGVRDTSEVGYIQRKLVKAMEDCKVMDDFSVRNASGQIIQFLYGEDGSDSTKLERHRVVYGEWTPFQFAAEYAIPDIHELSHVMDVSVASEDYKEVCEEHFMRLVEDREYLYAEYLNRSKDTPSSANILFPVAFDRILTMCDAVRPAQAREALSDLDPVHAIDKIDELTSSFDVLMFGILCRMYLSPKRLIRKYRMTRAVFDQAMSMIRQRLIDSLVHPGEMVGVLAAQSIGETSTQLTLNSVHYDTDMLFSVDGKLVKTKIGDYVHNIIDDCDPADVENHPNDTKLAWIRGRDVTVLSCDEDGKVSWQKVEAVTRHPVINEDGSSTLLRVTLDSGRQVVATKAKSFLTRRDNKIVGTNGSELKVGDCLPVSKILPLDGFKFTHLDVSMYLPKTEWIFMSEIGKALEFRQTCGDWFFEGNKRSDTSVACFGENSCQKQHYNADCVYPKYGKTCIPEHIPLDELFGFFCGAYLAEGCVTTHHILISNNDAAYNTRITDFCARYNIRYHVDHRNVNNGVSHTIRMHSVVLTVLIAKMFGKLSDGKKMPAELLAAPDEFLRGLLDGYFSGDGCIGGHHRYTFTAYSTSHELLMGLQQILTKYGIRARIAPHKHREYNTKPAWLMTLRTRYARLFAQKFKLTHPGKQERLSLLLSEQNQQSLSAMHKEYVPSVELSAGTRIMDYHKIADMLDDQRLCEADKEILAKVLREDVFYDKIVAISEEEYEMPYVYDLTVANTRTFNTYDGVCQYDTFHSSGISQASKVVRGVPRIRELLSATRKIKMPSMVIVPSADMCKDKIACNALTNKLQVLTFNQLVTRSRIYFDPDDKDTKISEDDEMLKRYAEFAETDPRLSEECSEKDASNPWVLRLELNRDALVKRGVTMLELADALIEAYENRVRCVFSDDASHTLIFRVRLDAPDTNDALTELRALESHLLENLVIWGHRAIKHTRMNDPLINIYNPYAKMFEPEKQWRIYTDGTDLQAVLGKEGVDASQTTTNDVLEVHEVLGIEAARQTLLNELYEAMENTGVNFRHFALLVDNMTARGKIMSVDRFGINRSDASAFSRASFEEVTDMIVNAGVFSELDNMNGVSANIMTGHIPKCGTGQSQISVNMDKMTQLMNEMGITRNDANVIFDGEDDADFEGDEFLNSVGSAMAELLPASLFRLVLPAADGFIEPVALPIIQVT